MWRSFSPFQLKGFYMESIEIEGFLTISKAHFEIKKINILIGTQASGKSIVAKLVYFFKKLLTCRSSGVFLLFPPNFP